MTLRVAFMCVQNAGRSQMATVFAEQERTERGLTEAVEILTGEPILPITSTTKSSR
jgi:protein-tyrosine-phosphatase